MAETPTVRQQIVSAILNRKALDGSGAVRNPDESVRLEEIERPAPIVMSAAAIEDGNSVPSGPKAEVAAFERLSLAARLAMAGDSKAVAHAQANGLNLEAFPTVSADDIEAAIAEVCRYYESNAADDGSPLRPARTGMILRGVRIEGPLSLYNARIPFPIRLIGCVIPDGVIVDHCAVKSFDLSGSAIGGLSATFLDTSGNVRLVRTVSLGPIDLGGARIRGVLDMSDSVVFPYKAPPEGAAFAGERGVLNLSLADIENECRFNRARIYGGLTMKGATIHRSMFMERTMIFSPIATLTRMAFQWLIRGGQGAGTGQDYRPPEDSSLAALIEQEKARPHVTTLLYARGSKEWEAESHGFPGRSFDPTGHSLLFRLLAETVRARTTAMRADGLTVHGSLDAKRLFAAGRVRIRYAELQGSLRLNGAYLRSSRQSFDALDALRAAIDVAPEPMLEAFVNMAEESRTTAMKRELGEGDSFAIDIRNTTIKGGVDLGPAAIQLVTGSPEYVQAVASIRPPERLLLQQIKRSPHKTNIIERSQVYGSIVANQAHVGAGLDLSFLRFEQSPSRPPEKSLDITHSRIGGDLTLFNARRVVGIEASYARIDGSVFLHGPIQRMNRDRETDADIACNRCDISGLLQMRSMTIGGDADLLFSAHDDIANPLILNLRHTKVAGALSVYPTLLAKPPSGTSPGQRDFDEVDDTTGSKVFLTKSEFEDFLAKNGLRRRRTPRRRGWVQRAWAMATGRPHGQSWGALMWSAASRPPEGVKRLSNLAKALMRGPKPLRRWRAAARLLAPFRISNEREPMRPRAHIDLRNVETRVLRHPPSAWPRRDGLQITRLKFESSGTSGPLGLPYYSREVAQRNPAYLARVRREAISMMVMGLAGFFLAWALEAAPQTAWLDVPGRVNVGLLWFCVWAAAALRHSRRKIQPRHSDLKPLATFWLALQRRRANPYRSGKAFYLPIEPYLVAANALRADGKLRSAEMVELGRARERRRTFSSRHHVLAKGAYGLIDRLAHYGFNMGRAVQWSVLLILVFAMAFEVSAKAGCVARLDPGKPAPPFVSTAFAADAFMPLLGTEQTKQWLMVIPSAPRTAHSTTPALPYICGVSIGLVWLLRVLGLLFVAIFAASLAARTESFFSRIQQ